MKRRRLISGLCLASVAAALIAWTGAAARAATEDVVVSWTVTDVWSTGFQAAVTVQNNTDSAMSPWQVTVPDAPAITSIWDARASAVAGGTVFSGEAWNASIAARSAASFGFIGKTTAGAVRTPVSCLVTGASCAMYAPPVPGTSASPSPSATPGPPAAPAHPVVTLKLTTVTDWKTGRTMSLKITNSGTKPINGWKVSMPWAGTSVAPWNAKASLKHQVLSLTNESWNGALAPGASATAGFTDSGSFAMPRTCKSSAGACAVTWGATPSVKATPKTSAAPRPSRSPHGIGAPPAGVTSRVPS